jgi:hypothetical protein
MFEDISITLYFSECIPYVVLRLEYQPTEEIEDQQVLLLLQEIHETLIAMCRKLNAQARDEERELDENRRKRTRQ